MNLMVSTCDFHEGNLIMRGKRHLSKKPEFKFLLREPAESGP